MFRFLLLLVLCACSAGPKEKLKIGVDAKWYPLDFGPQTSYVNGFVEDLLLEMAHYGGMEFEVTVANWDSLFDGLKEEKYDAVLSSLAPYEYHRSKYDFSVNFLDLGPVLIVRQKDKRKSLEAMKGELVGVIANDPAETLLAKYPEILIRSFASIPEMLTAVANGEIESAVLNRIPAVNFVRDLYASSLEIVGDPLTDSGLKLIAKKGKGERFNRYLESMKKKSSFNEMLKKWNL
jgi:ABC-type amino acid transport substrate-binding protein